MKSQRHKRPPRITLLVDQLMQEHDDAQLISGVGEPGYTPPSSSKRAEFHSTILMNWNRVDDANTKQKALENAGYMCGYCDEWTDIEGKAYRIQPDSHHWSPQWIMGDGELILKRHIRTNKATADDYIENDLINNPDACDTIGLSAYLWQMGFRRQDKDYDVGFRAGSDNPRKLFGELSELGDVVFQQTSTDQFGIGFVAWVRKTGWEDGHKDRTPVDVLFGEMRCDGTEYAPEIFALMPTTGLRASGTNTFCMSYSHDGQHCEASVDILSGNYEKNFSVINSDKYGSYRELLEELVRIGYAVSIKDQEDVYHA